jgi:hypothetical protein
LLTHVVKRNGVKSMIGTSGRQRVPVERITSYHLNIDIRKRLGRYLNLQNLLKKCLTK